jgi:CelD/BcsL family acetyltransferase involved in cellulose biosynthesis
VSAAALRFTLGARTLATIPRRLRRVALQLDDALAGTPPPLPPLGRDEDGYHLTSWPLAAPVPTTGLLRHERQRYARYYVDLTAGEAAWLAGLSGSTRSALKRKTAKFAAADGGTLDLRRYRTPDELAAFRPLARAVSATTYQERLLDMGLPDDPRSLAEEASLAAADRVRAWLLFLRGQPVAYLWGSAEAGTLRYEYVGHDPAHNALSPGTVLMRAALADLFADRFQRFDFTEGESQQKRGLASDHVECVDLLLLRPTLANRAALAALAGWDAAVALGKQVAPGLKRLGR